MDLKHRELVERLRAVVSAVEQVAGEIEKAERSSEEELHLQIARKAAEVRLAQKAYFNASRSQNRGQFLENSLKLERELDALLIKAGLFPATTQRDLFERQP